MTTKDLRPPDIRVGHDHAIRTRISETHILQYDCWAWNAWIDYFANYIVVGIRNN